MGGVDAVHGDRLEIIIIIITHEWHAKLIKQEAHLPQRWRSMREKAIKGHSRSSVEVKSLVSAQRSVVHSLSGKGVHCDHTVHVSADLSLSFDNPVFLAP